MQTAAVNNVVVESSLDSIMADQRTKLVFDARRDIEIDPVHYAHQRIASGGQLS
jgi:hypothetical protein